jgi:hypothetical protein
MLGNTRLPIATYVVRSGPAVGEFSDHLKPELE